MNISIIGTSGRNNDPNTHRLSASLFDSMVKSVSDLIISIGDPSEIQLVSGGAAWADHVAVKLFLSGRYKGLILYTPARFVDGIFEDTGFVDWRTNPGGTLNYYHRKFSEKIGYNSFEEIEQAIEIGAIIDSSSYSFHDRNSKVATADIMIALTWSTDKPGAGGTLDTWKKAPKSTVKYHISLSDL